MTDSFLQAKHYQPSTINRGIWWVVIHDEEYPESVHSAEDIAQMFHTTSRPASAHYCHDEDSTVQCVLEKDIAYHAPPNTHSLGMEHDGYAKQSREEWLTDRGKRMLDRSAKKGADMATRYGIPLEKIDVAALKASKKGFCGHIDITNAFHLTTHTDPGNFPWDYYMERVRFFAGGGTPPITLGPKTVLGKIGGITVARIPTQFAGSDLHGEGYADYGDIPWDKFISAAVNPGHIDPGNPVTPGYAPTGFFYGGNFGGHLRLFFKGEPNMGRFNVNIWTVD